MCERSEQFLKQIASLTYYWMFLRSINMPIGTNNWDVEHHKNKLDKIILGGIFSIFD